MGKKKMVGGVPMATIYQGMSIERLDVLRALECSAWDAVFESQYWDDVRGPEFAAAHAAEFQRLLDRAASKAGWHANNKNRNQIAKNSK